MATVFQNPIKWKWQVCRACDFQWTLFGLSICAACISNSPRLDFHVFTSRYKLASFHPPDNRPHNNGWHRKDKATSRTISCLTSVEGEYPPESMFRQFFFVNNFAHLYICREDLKHLRASQLFDVLISNLTEKVFLNMKIFGRIAFALCRPVAGTSPQHQSCFLNNFPERTMYFHRYFVDLHGFAAEDMNYPLTIYRLPTELLFYNLYMWWIYHL